MRTFWNGVLRGVALVAFLVVVGLPRAFADGPFDPPGARIKPPSGDPTEVVQIRPSGEDPTADGRSNPPTVEPAPEAGIGSPGFFELLLEWLRAQARIDPPIG